MCSPGVDRNEREGQMRRVVWILWFCFDFCPPEFRCPPAVSETNFLEPPVVKEKAKVAGPLLLQYHAASTIPITRLDETNTGFGADMVQLTFWIRLWSIHTYCPILQLPPRYVGRYVGTPCWTAGRPSQRPSIGAGSGRQPLNWASAGTWGGVG